MRWTSCVGVLTGSNVSGFIQPHSPPCPANRAILNAPNAVIVLWERDFFNMESTQYKRSIEASKSYRRHAHSRTRTRARTHIIPPYMMMRRETYKQYTIIIATIENTFFALHQWKMLFPKLSESQPVCSMVFLSYLHLLQRIHERQEDAAANRVAHSNHLPTKPPARTNTISSPAPCLIADSQVEP